MIDFNRDGRISVGEYRTSWIKPEKAAAWCQLTWIPVAGMDSPMERLTRAMVDSAAGAVELALGLVGVMTLFLGLMKVAEAGGLLRVIGRLLRPLMVRLFPDEPPEHPAMGAR